MNRQRVSRISRSLVRPRPLKAAEDLEHANVLDRPARAIAKAVHRILPPGPLKDLLHGVRPVKVTLGQSNDTHVQVTDGLTPGQDLLLLQVGQGRELLEKAGIKLAEAAPTTKPAGQTPPAAKSAGVAAAG